jgi:hypothetical protein
MLFKYLDYRRQAKRHSSSAAFISATARIGRVLVDGDETRIDRVRLAKRLAEKSLRCSCAAVCCQQEVDRLSVAVDGIGKLFDEKTSSAV